MISNLQTQCHAFSSLKQRVFDNHDLSTNTKISMKEMLYEVRCLKLVSKSNVCCRSCYTVVKPGHSTRKRLSSYAPSSRDTCGRFWFDFVSNEEVLAKSDVVDIEVLLAQSRLRWLGHVSRMEDNRTCKQLLYGELADGSRPIGRPKLCFKDNCKSILKTGNILHNWNDKEKIVLNGG